MTELAAQNAQEIQSHEDDSVSQYLTFLAGGETFAIGILDVNEIIEIEHITRVPMTPDFICGVINLRGKVVPVIELSSRLGRGLSGITKKSCIVLVETQHGEQSQTIGMLVDEVNEILEINEVNIQEPPNFGTHIRTDFIRAMGQVGEEFIVLLNVDHVLSVEELSSLQDMSSLQDIPTQAAGASLTTALEESEIKAEALTPTTKSE